MRLLITAGPTREKIDPVRFISNYSTGVFGYAIAEEAIKRGHRVTLISGPVAIEPPNGARVIRVESASQMRCAVFKALSNVDCIIMAAAVADWKPKRIAQKKIKKTLSGVTIKLVQTPDILEEIGKKKGRKILVGFALETEQVCKGATEKLLRKNLDIIVANKAEANGSAFGKKATRIWLIDRLGSAPRAISGSKNDLAKIILDKILAYTI